MLGMLRPLPIRVVSTLNECTNVSLKTSSFMSSLINFKLNSYSTSQFQLPLNFDTSFSGRATCSLLTAYSVLKSCSNPLILKHGPSILEKAGPLAIYPTKITYYKYFVGGESADACRDTVIRLNKEKISVVLDYSVEGLASESQAELLAQELIHSIEFSGKINKELGNQACRFGCVKMTGIANTSLLEKLSKILEFLSCDGINHGLSYEDRLRLAKEWIPSSAFVEEYLLTPQRSHSFNFSEVTKENIPKFTAEEANELDRLVKRFRRICESCLRNKIPLLVDAEQSYYQAAVDYLSMLMQSEYTGSLNSNDSFALIYNTYQNYLKDAKARMIHDHKFVTEKLGKKFAAKTVRGAYMAHERARASKLGIPDPIHLTIQDTHNSYNSSVEYALNHLNTMSIFVATHNVETLIKATDLIVNTYKVDPQNCPVVFAQLYGMGDSLSLALARSGFPICKYIPYGPVHEVMPYLSRRVTENGDIMSGTTLETRRIAQELKRRIPFFSS